MSPRVFDVQLLTSNECSTFFLFGNQVESIRKGLLKVIPQAVLDLLTWQELEKKICGDPEISVDALKKTSKINYS